MLKNPPEKLKLKQFRHTKMSHKLKRSVIIIITIIIKNH